MPELQNSITYEEFIDANSGDQKQREEKTQLMLATLNATREAVMKQVAVLSSKHDAAAAATEAVAKRQIEAEDKFEKLFEKTHE